MLSFFPHLLLLLLLLCDRGRENVFVRIPFFAIESRFDNFPNLDFVLTTKTQERLFFKKKQNNILSDVVTFNLGESLSTSTKAHVHIPTGALPLPPPSQNSMRTQHPSVYMYCQCMGKRLISAPVCSPLASSVILSLAKKGIEERECRTMPPFLRAHTMLGVT